MMQRFRDRILDFFDELSARSSRRRQRRTPVRLPGAIKGNMRSILVVQPPDSIFSQAVFILRDDCTQQGGLSREELLRQAREAANIYCGSIAPPHVRRSVPALIIAAASSAVTLLILHLSGLI